MHRSMQFEEWCLRGITVQMKSTKVLNPRRYLILKPGYIKTIMHMRTFRTKNGRLYVLPSLEGMLDLCNGAVSEKTPQIF